METKKRLIASITGIFLACVFLLANLSAVVAQSPSNPVVRQDLANSLGLSTSSVTGVLYNFLIWILGFVGILGLIGFTISGVIYLVSIGDQERIERAKKTMTYSVVGIIVALLGFSIMLTIYYIIRPS